MNRIGFSLCLVLMPGLCCFAQSQDKVEKQFRDFDGRMETILSEWKVPGCAIGVVKGGKLVYAKGFGYRDIENKLPVTASTLFPIASNTKLFTAIAAGMLVNEGKLDWDKPIKLSVPEIEFNTIELNGSVSLRDMLSHRTGIAGYHDLTTWNNFSREELFSKIRLMIPSAGTREAFIYSNLMYAAVGSIIKLKTGKTWESFIYERLLKELSMKQTVFSIDEMIKTNDFAKGYHSNISENSYKLVAYYTKGQAKGPAGSIMSSVHDMSNWAICLLANGKFNDKQVIPSSIVEETFRPASFSDIPVLDKEISLRAYGLGRELTTYRGHFMSDHGGKAEGFLSQVTLFPDDDIGVIVLTNSTGHDLRSFLALEIADRILNLEKIGWSERYLERTRKSIEESKRAEEKQDAFSVKETSISHPLIEYAGTYENPLYGKIEIKIIEGKLLTHFQDLDVPLSHLHYDQFKTPEHRVFGSFQLSFMTGPKGDIDEVITELDQKQTSFKKTLR